MSGPAIQLQPGTTVIRVEARFGRYENGRWYGYIPALSTCSVEDQETEVAARQSLMQTFCGMVAELRHQAKPIPWKPAEQIPPANWDETTRIFALA